MKVYGLGGFGRLTYKKAKKKRTGGGLASLSQENRKRGRINSTAAKPTKDLKKRMHS